MTDTASGPFTIRLATNADIPAIRSVLLEVRLEFGVLNEDAEEPELNDLHANFFERGGLFLVVENAAGCIVGAAGLQPLSQTRAELGKMYLQPAVRGLGIGRQLLHTLLATARANGFAEVWLETNSKLTDAIALYRRCGFEPDAPSNLLPKCDVAFLLKL